MLAEAALLAVLSVERGPGAETCLGAAQLKRSVERRLKRRVFVDDAAASLRLRVRFVARQTEIEARIELSSIDGSPRGVRSLVTAGHCSALDDSLALSVALLVDEPPDPIAPVEPASAEAGEKSTNSPASPSKPRPTPLVPKTTITIPPEVAAPREPWHARLGVAGKVAWGALPSIRPAVAVALGILPRAFVPVLLQGEAFWPANAERDSTSGARFHLLRVGLALCPVLWQKPGRGVSLCLGQQLGWLTVDGYGFDHDSKQQRLGYSLIAGGEGRLRLFPPVSIRGYVGGEVPLVRDRFSSAGRDASELFRASPIALVAEIGLETALW
jgi:hypothetical protein